ncbi:FAD-dependent oxidoreductase [Mangrovibacterium diazotrophicum]|uniref:NADPH-dependent 2,4-dienoyl-CoA reductase/sulfur reductase-like enzyme n=1 Tax=Mangrovibacterium diazotrophicum TaxID=1261403 RepID=A0A419W9V0_9BACT|nr:FAD-dependent oxidoreductase [Mangrovibacterium diazotrophicum]RKD92219.1 NADPH-dependent 2,4-dienoyl-CoA reductase/sulfur reductase-like enzyme [Mangrovibacterium diazotrophicum]
MEKILIIGGVAAGATAAAKARRLSPDAQITMLEAGPDISFANCGLPYYIAGDIDSRSKLILQSPESFDEQYQVKVHTNTLVNAIDRANKKVQTTDSVNGSKNTFEYTKLILAQGGRPIQPEIPGATADHVFSLWTLDDMDKIDNHLSNKDPKTAVVVGGGFIGLEMVEALVKRGLKVHVVEKMPHVMSIMEAEIAGFITRELKAYGVGVHTETAVTKINANSVELENGQKLNADMVLLSIGVRPTLQLAKDAGLEIGEAGGLLVNNKLQTSDPDIYAAGDMVEIEHRVSDKKVRIPLAGPANRQGRIAAENALGGQHSYKGSIGTSVVRVFEAVAGTTGLSLKQARAAGIDADAVVVHKEHHTAYYPGAETVTVLLVYDKNTGVVLGGQTAGYKGADKRLDVIATACAAKLPVADIADIDFAYSPPIGTANDAMNMAAYVAENKISGYGPSLMVSELDDYLEDKEQLIVLDIRDVFAHQKSNMNGAYHIPLEMLHPNLDRIPTNIPVLIYDETGKKGHQAVRMLIGAGHPEVNNISGGHTSLQRHAAAVGFKNINMVALPIEKKTIGEKAAETVETNNEVSTTELKRLVIDVRTPGEFRSGAFPDAINIPLDDLMQGKADLGEDTNREIIVYCASGARSAYAKQILQSRGFSNVTNGGGISAMMSRY